MPDFVTACRELYLCWFVPAGAVKLRDGPVLVANSTRHVALAGLLAQSSQVAASVGVYQESPWSIRSGAASSCSVP